jgi:hypothetical protein
MAWLDTLEQLTNRHRHVAMAGRYVDVRPRGDPMKVVTVAMVLMLLSFVSAVADEKPQSTDKGGQAFEPYWNPNPLNLPLVDVAEDEGTNNACPGQAFGCGSVLRPANLTAGDNDYFYFTANAGDIISFGTDADGTPTVDTFIHLYNADCSTQLASDDDSGPGTYSLLTLCAPYTGTYVARVRGFGATSAGLYKAFVTCSGSGGYGDNCSVAGALQCGDVNLAGNTGCSNNDYSLPTGAASCTGFTSAGRDQVLLLLVGGGASIDLFYTSTADASIYIVDTCAPLHCLAGADATLSGQTEHLVYNFPAPGAYYLILDSFGTNTAGAWTLTGTFMCGLVSARSSTWGQIKTIYR